MKNLTAAFCCSAEWLRCLRSGPGLFGWGYILFNKAPISEEELLRFTHGSNPIAIAENRDDNPLSVDELIVLRLSLHP